ncbi:MAG: hypothetical protein RIR88_150 [Actinomycetota bacterium]
MENHSNFPASLGRFPLMPFDNLFADIEQQLTQELEAEIRDQLADDERQRLARLSLRERIRLMSGPRRAYPDSQVELRLRTGQKLTVSPVTHGRDWFAADLLAPGDLVGHGLVPLAAIASLAPTVEQLQRSLGDPVTSVSREDEESLRPARARLTDQIGLPFVLRDISRRRKPVELTTSVGVIAGTIDRVGSDHLDLAIHAPDQVRRARGVSEVRIVAMGDITLVRLL